MSSERIPAVVRFGPHAYGWLLFLYPSALRARLRDELTHVFEQQLHFAWQARGYCGVLRSLWLRHARRNSFRSRQHACRKIRQHPANRGIRCLGLRHFVDRLDRRA